jgi:hypothetical protein
MGDADLCESIRRNQRKYLKKKKKADYDPSKNDKPPGVTD